MEELDGLLSWLVRDLVRGLKQTKPREFKVVVMPDFFIDRFVTYRGDLKQFSAALAKVVERRGGNIHGVKQMELRGGNAANTAAALASLGASVYPIITTDVLGLHFLEFHLGPLGVNLSHVKSDGKIGLTTALEITDRGERVNVMMGALGSLPLFGPEDLAERDFRLLQQVDYVGVFNWAATSKRGTELAEDVFRYVKEEGKGKTYFDSGDPTPNKTSIPKLFKNVLKTRLLDILSVNENEAFQYASQFDKSIVKLRGKVDNREVAKECARILARNLTARVDLHTAAFSGSFTRENEVIVPGFSVKSLRSTGAGDSWNAGNIYGDALKLPDSCRLMLANAVAGYYISSPRAEHPTPQRLIEFCQERARD
jgi:sugar/nucleoside kinase (ribokinase family)